ncbi:MAG: zf-HC2 domain-containing protein [Actinobacteria bacterium]|nr:zf-HC2 domain-containing protein [Actinomycetota bacterium]
MRDTGFADDPCRHCEQMMQPYLDRALSESERVEAEGHLEGCDYCGRRYRFEESLRRYVRQTCAERMAPELKEKLVALRTPLL